MKEKKALVIKFGGSEATGMEGARKDYLYDFLQSIGSDVFDTYDHIGLVIGGGPRVRALQANVEGDTAKNLVAREVMWEHAETLRDVANAVGLQTVASVPHSPEEMYDLLNTDKSQTIVMSWLKDRQSSDASSILLLEKWAQEIRTAEIVILSNVAYIFTHNPNEVTTARAIIRSNVNQLVRERVLSDDPNSFKPGDHVVIDPVAVSILVRNNNKQIPLFFSHGNNPGDVGKFLTGEQPHYGTLLHNKYSKTVYLK